MCPTLDIFQARDKLAVRITPRIAEDTFELTHDFLPQHVLDFLGVVVHMIGGVVNLVGEVELPKSVVADHLAGAFPAGRRKGKTNVL